jgi:hypothetical protein
MRFDQISVRGDGKIDLIQIAWVVKRRAEAQKKRL